MPRTLGREHWPPHYVSVFAWRQRQVMLIRSDKRMRAGAMAYYRTNPVAFINHWVDTYDPRNAGTDLPAYLPLVLFPAQERLVLFLHALVQGQADGLVEKCRDMGATWVSCAFSVWLWLFYDGSSVGWGSRKEALVDKLGDPDSIFEKMRIIVNRLPREFWPAGFRMKEHATFMRLINPENGASVTGEAGDDIGRGGRKLIYFKDESAHYERPEKIEAALGDTTRVQVDISSVNGLGNVFHRKREAGVEWAGGAPLPGKVNVFVMDWQDHPAKDQAWYEMRRSKAEEQGLLHKFAQEVDRDYSASVDGVIIPAAWIRSAIDAAVALGFEPSGSKVAGLDVADEGGDANALALRQGPCLLSAASWPMGDTGVTTRRTVAELEGHGPVEVQYDSIGVGAGVKSEANRLAAEGLLRPGLSFVPWNAGEGPQFKDKHLEPDDPDTPLNGDFYANLKAQAWWQLRRRFERTHRAVTEGIRYDPAGLISIPGALPELRRLQKELGQPTIARTSSSLKLIVDKSPPGTRSPNLADAVVQAYWPKVDDSPVALMLLKRGR